MTLDAKPALRSYLPRLLVEWSQSAPHEHHRVLSSSLVSLDISGFTSLSERLQAKGRLGAEELILLISGVFEGLIGIADRHAGDVLKFRGDALLLLFSGAEHELRACQAATEMQWFIEQAGETMSSVGPVQLRMSTGVYSGECHFYLVGSTHRELVVTGPAATATVQLESAAQAGEVLVSGATAAALEPEWLGEERAGARLLRLPLDAGPESVRAVEPSEVQAHALEQFVPAPLRPHLALASGEGEHRQVTAAFLKYSGTDDLLAAEGPEAVLERLAALADLVCATAEQLELTWLESDVDVGGGKFYLVAGAPSSTGAEEERMLRALRRIIDAGVGPSVQAGVNRGPAFAGDIGASSRRTYAVMGDTVNLAARLTARAQPGEILASADVLDRSRTRFDTTHRPFLMKGKERPVTAYSVGAVVGVREEAAAGSLPLVGRERELAVLVEALSGARMRQSRLIELVGEAGIGKSRLVEELRRSAVGFQQLATRCEQYERSNPFFAFRTLLRPLAGITPEQSPVEAGAQLLPWVQAVMPDLAPWLPLLAIPFDAEVPSTPEAENIDPAFRRDRLHEVIEQFMTRVLLMPTLIVVEDAHWIDDASGYLLRHLASSTLPRPWLVCVTRRPEGAPFADEERDTQLALEPLRAEQATALALAAAEDVALGGVELSALTERAAGNPLFVRELVAAARAGQSLEALPESVETLMTARIDRLDPGDRLLLRYASVVGPTFDLGLLNEILTGQPVQPEDLDRWRRLSEFVTWESGETLHFRHELFRAMAYEGLSYRRRADIHGKVAEALERRAGDAAEEAAGLLSLHFLAAGQYEQAWRYAVVAGGRAHAIYANVVAADLYERALAAARHLPELPPDEVATVWESLGDVAELFARYDTAQNAYEQARRLVEHDGLASTRLMWKSGVIRERAGRYDEALDWYRRALERIETLGLGERAASNKIELELGYAGVLYRQGNFAGCAEWSERASAHAEEAGDRQGLAHAAYLLDIAYTRLGRPDWSHRERALEIYEELGNLVGHATVLNNLGTDAYHESRWEEAVAYYRQSAELSRQAGDVSSVARAALNESELLSDRGLLAEAEELLHDALRVWRAASYPLGAALATSNLGRTAARAGRFEEAQRLFQAALEVLVELGLPIFAAETRARSAEAHVLAGEHREALELATAALSEIESLAGPPSLRALLERLIGYALVQQRLPEEGRPHFEQALEIARAAGAVFEVALALRALAEAGAPDAALLDGESDEILQQLGVVSLPVVPLP